MTFLVVLLLSMVKVSLLLKIDVLDPGLYRDLEVRQLRSAEAWKRLGGEFTSVEELLDSAADGQSPRMRAYQLMRMLRPRQVPAFHRSLQPIRKWHRSHPHIFRVPTRDRSPDLLKVTRISRSETLPGNDIDITLTDETGSRWKKSPLVGDELISDGIDEIRLTRPTHPIYLGMGQDAVDEAYKAYINIVSPSTRNSRKASINPVDFVGKR